MLQRDAIAHPREPFVLIFFHGGDEYSPYGFATDGEMTKNDWMRVFNHIGYLSPYSVFKPKSHQKWTTLGYDVAVKAAQALARPSGGSIMGAPRNSAQESNVLAAYAEPLGLKMTHFFHDDERDFGTPGGGGATRIKIASNTSGARLVLEQPRFFGTAEGGALENLKVSFGALFGNYMFGGATRIMAIHAGDTRTGASLIVEFRNEGGYRGHSRIIVFSSTSENFVESLPLSAEDLKRWNEVSIFSGRDADPRYVDVTIAVAGVGSSTGRIKKPAFNKAVLELGDPAGQRHDVHYDDIQISKVIGSEEVAVASYDFECSAPLAGCANEPIRAIHDCSGNGHELIVKDGKVGTVAFFSTKGIDGRLRADVKRHLVDALLASRRRSAQPDPVLLTNWRLADRPGRFAAWKSAGFTHASSVYYFPGGGFPGGGALARIFWRSTKTTQWAWEDGSKWAHAWIGNSAHEKGILDPDKYGSLITLAVLDGTRWFSVFTAMSSGSLGPAAASQSEKAVANADSLYGMAIAASWFQSTRAGLKNSIFVEDLARRWHPSRLLVRARRNPGTNEMWFAALVESDDGTARRWKVIEVPLPARKGTIVELATGKRWIVGDGKFRLDVGNEAHPYYFLPFRLQDGGSSGQEITWSRDTE